MALKLKGKHAPLPAAPPSFEEELLYGLREPNGPSEFEVFVAELSDDQQPHAKMLYQMSCLHTDAEVVMQDGSWSNPDNYVHVRCPRCILVFKRFVTKTPTKLAEWMLYCPDGFDMFEWEDLFVADKKLWPFIFDAAQESMLDASLTKED